MRGFSEVSKSLSKSAFLLAAIIAVATQPLYIFASIQRADALGASAVVYDALPSISPPTNYPSLGYQATSTSSLADSVHLGGTNRKLAKVTVTLSNWAKYSDYSADPLYSGNTSTWSHPITVNVYSNHLGGNGSPDTLLATKTQSVDIPWRPESDPSCAPTSNGTGWKVGETCYNFSGLAMNTTFDLANLNVTLPENVIVEVAYDTQSYGSAPKGVTGPYNSLNVAIPANQAVTVGSDSDTDLLFWNSTFNGRSAGLTVDTAWTPNGTIAMQITATAVPTVQACATTNALKTTDLTTWYLGETRTSGSNELMANGLHVRTTPSSGSYENEFSKAAGYHAANFALEDAGTPDISIASGYSGVRPSLQLGVDKDANGTWDGYLVYEPWAYGEGNYWSSKNFDISSGMGYTSFGTLNEYLGANPNARVISIGYSLGSGVVGDATITKITAGCTEYIFGLSAPTSLTPANNTLTNDPAFVNTWSVVSGAAGYEYRTANVLNGSELGTIIYSDNSTNQAGRYSTSGGTVTRQNGGTPNNDYYWQARAVDSAGTPGPWSVIHKVSVDASAPSVPTNGNPRNNTYKNTNDFYFTWSASTDTNPVKYEFQSSSSNAVDANGSLMSAWNSIANGNSEQNNLTSSQIHSTGATDGHYYWQVRAFDNFGNKSAWSTVWGMSIDTQKPPVPLSLSWVDSDNQSAQNGSTNSQKGTLSWTDATPSDVDHYVYKFWTNIPGYVEGQSNAWTTSDSQYITTTLTGGSIWTNFEHEGTYYFCVEAVDRAGNKSACSDTLAITYDKTAPVAPTALAWTTSTGATIANGGVTNKESGVASWSASTSSDVHHYIYKYWNDISGDYYATTPYLNSPITDTSLGGAFTQGEGVHYFAVATVDAAGNVSAFSTPFKITYDKTAPIVTVTAIADTTDTTPTLSGNTSESEGDVDIWVDGVKVQTVTSNALGNWSWTPASALTIGQHTVAASVTDSAGNVSESGITFTIEQAVVLGVNTGTSNPTTMSTLITSPAAVTTSETSEESGSALEASTPQVLAAEDTNTTAAPVNTTSTVEDDSSDAGKILGLKWFWWLIILLAVAGLWWFIAAWRSRKDDKDF